MTDPGGSSAERPTKRRAPEMVSQLAGEGLSKWLKIVLAASSFAAIAAYIPAKSFNEGFRSFVGYNEEENVAIRKRLVDLQKRKAELGIKRDLISLPQRIARFFERLYGEFEGDVAKWLAESEPVLELRIQHVRLLEFLNFATFYPVFLLVFGFSVLPIRRALDRFVDKMKGKNVADRVTILEHDTGGMAARIQKLESWSSELHGLEILAKVLLAKDVHLSPLSPDELEKAKAGIARGMEIFETLAQDKGFMTEITPEELREVSDALRQGKKLIDSVEPKRD